MSTDYWEKENLRKQHTDWLVTKRLETIEEGRKDLTEEQMDFIEALIANIEMVLIERGFPVEFL